MLISWNDFRDEHQLLIPIESGAKVPELRQPTIYHGAALPAARVQELVRAFNAQ